MKLPELTLFKEIVLMALDNVRAHKLRSFLTILGIIIGVMTAITIASILAGLRHNIVRMTEQYGTNSIYAFHRSAGIQIGYGEHSEEQRKPVRIGPGDRSDRQRKPLRVEDGEAIKQGASAVEEVSNVLFIRWWDSTINYQGTNYRGGQMQGVSANHQRCANLSVSEGRFITETDDANRRDVMVVGVNVVEALFDGRTNVVGRHVKLGGKDFEIIGVLEKRKSGFFGENEEDNAVFIPFRTARKLSPGSKAVMLLIRARTGRLAQALDQVEEILRRQRGVKSDEANNFNLGTPNRIIEQFDQVTSAVGLVAITISSVGLLVGGIGVMNIMLVAVTERTQEIGARKALGARRKDIVRQFLYEAMALTFLGGVLGVLLAILISKLLMFFIPSLPAAVPAWAVVTGLLVSVAVGLVFGIWPARKASKLDPIECLRHE